MSEEMKLILALIDALGYEAKMTSTNGKVKGVPVAPAWFERDAPCEWNYTVTKK